MVEPRLVPTRYGTWLALGDGWAVTGDTEAEALAAYLEADARHDRIDARPPHAAPGRREEAGGGGAI